MVLHVFHIRTFSSIMLPLMVKMKLCNSINCASSLEISENTLRSFTDDPFEIVNFLLSNGSRHEKERADSVLAIQSTSYFASDTCKICMFQSMFTLPEGPFSMDICRSFSHTWSFSDCIEPPSCQYQIFSFKLVLRIFKLTYFLILF